MCFTAKTKRSFVERNVARAVQKNVPVTPVTCGRGARRQDELAFDHQRIVIDAQIVAPKGTTHSHRVGLIQIAEQALHLQVD